MENDNRVKEIDLINSKSDRVSIRLTARIEDDGDLVLEGCDYGPLVSEQWGDSDYEYWLRVGRDYKDTVLLWLIKERFANDSEFRQWLDEKRIPNKFDSWI
jgi:hypothetical protein